MVQHVSGRDAGRPLADVHLLLVREGLPVDVVTALVTSRHPDAVRTPEGGLRLGRHTRLVGPLLLDAAAASAAGVPGPWRAAWALECPTEREGPPLPGATDRDGLARAFPGGLPAGEERLAVDLGIALARRLEGALRVHPSGGVLRPDPGAWVDRVVVSRYWLAPDDARAVAAAAVPEAGLATEGAAWAGLRPEAVAALEAEGSGEGLTDAEREGLHLAADRRDAIAASAGVLDGYALVVPLGGVVGAAAPGDDGGVVEVRVSAAEALPPALAPLGWSSGAVEYRVTWWPGDEAEAEREVPTEEHRAARAEAAAVVRALADALVGAVQGVVLDAEGFPLTPVR